MCAATLISTQILTELVPRAVKSSLVISVLNPDPTDIFIEKKKWKIQFDSPQVDTVFVRISDMARISATFGLFYVLWCYFEMRHYFNDVKVPKNAQDQCEFEYLFIF
jgi:hypothetical protein